MQESYRASELHELPKIAALIKENKNQLASFLLENPKGPLLLDYMIALSEWWQKDQANIQNQLNFFAKNIQHIKNIIKIQQSIDNSLGLKEKISINLLIDGLLAIFKKNLESSEIRVKKDYQYIPEITIDRSLVVQILENLLRNALEALEGKLGERELTIRTQVLETNIIQIEVMDNGIGLAPEQKAKIFSYGFTLKKDVHGCGLHNRALLAKELGGN